MIYSDMPLSDAPEHFFDPGPWAQVLSAFPNRGVAVGFLGQLEPNNQDHRECAEIGTYLIDRFGKELREGNISATGLCALVVGRVEIPSDRWEDSWPDFPGNRTRHGSLEFTSVSVSRPTEQLADDVLRNCDEWMQRQAQAGNSLKKALLAQAQVQFGPALTTRIFDAAYKRVFNRGRGRPRRDTPKPNYPQ
jgi:hypothetical protein